MKHIKHGPALRAKATVRLIGVGILLTSAFAGNAAADCTIGEVRSWNTGFMIRDIDATNNTAETISTPQVLLSFSSKVGVDGVWGADVAVVDEGVILRGRDYNTDLKPGEKASFGFKGKGNPAGVKCTMMMNGVALPTPDAPAPTTPTTPTEPSQPPVTQQPPANTNGRIVWQDDQIDSSSPGDEWRRIDDTRIVADCGSGRGQCLEVSYAPTSRGSDRLQKSIPIPSGTDYTLLYDIRFGDDFEFVRGGKLPGLSPDTHTTGCKPTQAESWSARPMWRASGSAQGYYYGQDRTGRCGDGFRSAAGAFKPGQWQTMALRVKLNSAPDTFDGEVTLRVDGQIVSSNELKRLRSSITDASEISRFFFSTFYGGADSSWAPSKTTTIRYDNFRVVNNAAAGTNPPAPVVPAQPAEPETQEPTVPAEPTEPTEPEVQEPTVPSEPETQEPPAPVEPEVQEPVAPIVPTPPATPEPQEPVDQGGSNANNYVLSRDMDSLPSGFHDKRSWRNLWAPAKWANGADEGRIFVDESVQVGNSGKSVRMLYPANRRTSSDSGAQWHMGINGVEADELYLSYWVRFDDNFDFVLGGKLPGLSGSVSFADRTHEWSGRLMWRENGDVEFYTHMADQRERWWWNTSGFQAQFVAGRWHHVEIRFVNNTPGQSDGIMQGWFDGVQAAYYDQVKFRAADEADSSITRVFFSTFFGGSSGDRWNATKDEFAWFDNFIVSRERIGYPGPTQ